MTLLVLVARYEREKVMAVLRHGAIRIGSAPDNDFRINFPGVSRRHAIVRRDGDTVRILDLQSRHGTVVGGRLVDEAAIAVGEPVTLGPVQLVLEEAADADFEVAVELRAGDERPLAEARSERSRETDSLHGSTDASGPEAALALVTRYFSGNADERPGIFQILVEGMEILGAESLFVVEDDAESPPSVEFLAGAAPTPEIVLATTKAKRPAAVTGPECVLLSAEIRGTNGSRRHFLGAVLPPHSAAAEPWQTDFVSFLAGSVSEGRGGPASPDSRPRQPALWGDLRVPAEMVVGPSEAMRRLMDSVRATADSRLNVLVYGETGTGKELFARLLHDSGPTRNGPFVVINCAAIPSELLESELFGVQGRVATGVDPRTGRFVLADGGTAVLDEVGELAPPLQAKLLRFLQEGEVHPLGAAAPRKVNVRVIAASNRDLRQAVREGQFRADLYYRLRGLQFHIPPLRDRRDDLAALVRELTRRASLGNGRHVLGVSRKALDLLAQYDWPGNIRELQSEIERAVLACPQGDLIREEHFPTVAWELRERRRDAAPTPIPAPEPDLGFGPIGTKAGGGQEEDPRAAVGQTAADRQSSLLRPLQEQVRELEQRAIHEALAATRGNKTKAARILGVTRAGLLMKVKRLLG